MADLWPFYVSFMAFYVNGFLPYKFLYFECYETMPMLADPHISSLGHLWYLSIR